MQTAERTATQLVQRLAVLILALVGVFDAAVINILVSAYHRIQQILGGTSDPSHGFIGFGVCLIGLIGAFAVLKWPTVAAVLLLIAGVAFFFVVHWWALLASPQWIVAAALAFTARSEAVVHADKERPALQSPEPSV